MTEAKDWGGARRGAGRPGLKVVRTPSVKLEAKHAEALDNLRAREGIATDAEAVRWLIARDAELARRRAKRAEATTPASLSPGSA